MSERGFSLLSVLVAIVLTSVALLALAGVGLTTQSVRTVAHQRSVATTLAAAYLEEVKGRDPGTLASETPVKIDEIGNDNPNGPFERELVVESLTDWASRITVRITHPGGSFGNGVVELQTILFTAAG